MRAFVMSGRLRDSGWWPRYPAIEDVVRTAWEWHCKHPTGYDD